jgi:hypothetical protein
MPGRLILPLAALLVAVPLAAAAEGVDFTPPQGYAVAAPPAGVNLPVIRVWGRVVDGVHHSIVASVGPADRASLDQVVDANVASVTGRHAIGVARAAAPPLCGAPSATVSYAYEGQLTYVYRYVVVAGRVMTASYAHPVGTTADPAALAALDTLCSGVHQPAGPAGWTIAPHAPGTLSMFFTPNFIGGQIIGQATPLTSPDAGPAPFAEKEATITSERDEPCGALRVHHVTATRGSSNVEYVAGVLRGYSYANVYMYPASGQPNTAALATIRSFCAETSAPAPAGS